jgi:8-amino-7-oxononanoate synthase
MDLFAKCSENKAIEEVKKQGIYPYFYVLCSGQNTEVMINNKKVVMIGSNNYLGLTSDERVKEAGMEAIKKYGSGCSGSRFLNGTLDIHVQLEKALAKFLHKEAALTFSTGFQSNLGIISAICGRNDVIIGDKENHASIYDACRLSYAKLLRYNHNDMAELEQILANVEPEKGMLIVTDGVFSMSGDIAKLPEICALARKYGARVMVDDAHGFGVLGETGRGTAEYYGLEDEVDIIMGTFSKTLASLGGYMVAKQEVVEYVKHHSRPFIFSASITPASAACALTALKILEQEPERVKNLTEISNYMRKKLKEYGVKIVDCTTPIIPIFTYDDIKTFQACKMLMERGVYVNPVISPAVPVGGSMLRTSYTATHTKEQMDYAALKIKEVLEILEII